MIVISTLKVVVGVSAHEGEEAAAIARTRRARLNIDMICRRSEKGFFESAQRGLATAEPSLCTSEWWGLQHQYGGIDRQTLCIR
ncbi:hypothetical protein [Variovorax sp. MHTC-1]|uniref:hypothetical protein n=1 Tax=Variovorax sp. MHTC-1 TaxID=2495593 RepID=UPI001C8D877F|nr:hypothetical protein [Variovorax sp. MHTC-1]